ncbi:MAG TPA: PPOX class F420-dependent oxidoreductase [Lapillicoccus sp.]|nr:PPOX class F420-dependent oxidoreductase [Lapillicoccus sp.]
MATLPTELVDMVQRGPMAHVTTLNSDGSPQVSVVWVGLDGDDLVTGHLHYGAKLRNVERDPRTVISMDAPRTPGVFLNPYAVVHAHATVEPSDEAWDLLDRLAKVYVSPETTFPAPQRPGFVIRYRVERIGGVGPWIASDS